MCGVAGFTHETDRFSSPHSGGHFLLIHRRPDQQGVYESSHVSLGAVRLTIIDLVSGEQPMRSEDGDTVLVYNGEEYNHAELRADSRPSDIRFFTRSDTEVVYDAFLEWDTECFRAAARHVRSGALCESRRRFGFGAATASASSRSIFAAKTPHLLQLSSFEPKSPLPGNGISRAETKRPKTASTVQGRRAETKSRSATPPIWG